MKRLLHLSVLSAMLVLALAAVAWAQTPSCLDDDGFCASPALGTAPSDSLPTEQPESVPGVPDYTGPLAGDVPQYQYDSEAPAEEFPAICSANTLDQFPEGTVCTEGGGFTLPEDTGDGLRQTPDGLQYSDLPDAIPGPTQTTSPTVNATTTTALPATGGPSLALLAGTLLVGTGLMLRRH